MLAKTLELFPEKVQKKVVPWLVEKLLKKVHTGHLTLSYDGETRQFGQSLSDSSLNAHIEIHTSKAFIRMISGGSIGVGESYMKGEWSTPDLISVVRLFVQNIDILDEMEKGLASFSAPFFQWFHKMRKNTLKKAKDNISEHYDLGNDFFQLFLDPTMMYSSAVFETRETSLEDASIAKLDRICRKLDLSSEDHLLEIGTGWGSMAIYAAKHYGCRVTTATISEEQFKLVQQRIVDEGLQDKITLLLEDYRKLTGQFDKLVSIEMIEAVGHEYFETYFEKCSSLLKPNGKMALQSIVIRDQRYENAKKNVDFIQRYIFPGGCLPSVEVISRILSKVTDFQISNLEQIGEHYAETLHRWRVNFHQNLKQIAALGYPEEFQRMWDYYLGYCEGGFREHYINCAQIVLEKPQHRLPSPLGRFE